MDQVGVGPAFFNSGNQRVLKEGSKSWLREKSRRLFRDQDCIFLINQRDPFDHALRWFHLHEAPDPKTRRFIKKAVFEEDSVSRMPLESLSSMGYSGVFWLAMMERSVNLE